MNIMLTFVVLTTVGRTSLWDISNYFWDCISSLAGVGWKLEQSVSG